MWNIWKMRNLAIFENAYIKPAIVLEITNFHMQKLYDAQQPNLAIQVHQSREAHHILPGWRLSPEGSVKFNCNATFFLKIP